MGRLLYLMLTRPDITFVVNQLSQFMAAPRDSHWQATLCVVQYIKTAPNFGILLSSDSPLRLHAHCDANCAS